MICLNADYYDENDLLRLGIKKIGTNVKVAKTCTIVGLDNIEIGNNVRIDTNCVLTATNSDHPMVIGSYIHIGSNCTILGNAGFVMKDFSGLSHGVRVFTNSDDFSGEYLFGPVVPKNLRNPISSPIVLEKYVLIGTNSIILPGAILNEGVAVGAMSLVKNELTAWKIYAGVPSKIISDRKQDLENKARSIQFKEN